MSQGITFSFFTSSNLYSQNCDYFLARNKPNLQNVGRIRYHYEGKPEPVLTTMKLIHWVIKITLKILESKKKSN